MKNKGADLFPVATGVQIPFVGKEISVDTNRQKSNLQKFAEFDYVSKPSRRAIPSDRPMFKNVNLAAQMSVDPIKQIHQISKEQLGIVEADKSKFRIDNEYLHAISDGFLFSEDVIKDRGRFSQSYASSSRPCIFKEIGKYKSKGPKVLGRHNARYTVMRHYPCHVTVPKEWQTENLEMKKSKPLPGINNNKNSNSGHNLEQNLKPKAKGAKPSVTWDEYLMTLLSRETAEMVIKEFTSGEQNSKLNQALQTKYDKATDMSNETLDHGQGPSKHRLGMNEYEYGQSENEKTGQKSESNTEDTKQKVSSKLFAQLSGNWNSRVDINPNFKPVFDKVLEKSYPCEPEDWYKRNSDGNDSKLTMQKKSKKIKKGMQKWSDYPKKVEDAEIHKMTLSDITPVQSVAELDPRIVKKHREDANLVRLVEEWRGKWFLEKRWESSSCEELLRGMNDINDHVRLSAVFACGKAMLNKKLQETKSKEKRLMLQKDDANEYSDVPVAPEIFQKITELLSDRCKQVQVASAITLFVLNRATQKAKEVLINELCTGGPPERWAAAQCLAYAGNDSDPVVRELISHVNSPDVIKHSKAVKLMAKLSKLSMTVLYMMAEQLNSNSWRDRVVACQVLPLLQGPLSKDVANKISHLMWNDWSRDVRTAAARALGQTGNGKLVHDKLRERLIDGNETEILDAIRKISHLGIMTGRLLPCFVQCLKSDYISIRLEAVKAVTAIHFGHEDVIDELLRLTKEERSWKVKAHCIKALGIVAKPTNKVQEILLWCLRYEREAAIRAEACRAICNLNLKSERTIEILQDRIVVEEDPVVLSEVASTLKSFGVKPTGDLTMQEAVQKEVKRLCNRDTIATAIVTQDLKNQHAENQRKYLATDEEDVTPMGTKKSSKAILPANSLTSATSMQGFDPILEGFKIRSQISVAVPDFPMLESPVLDYDAVSETGEIPEASQEFNEQSYEDEDCKD